MNRRRLIAAAGTTMTGAVGGCLGRVGVSLDDGDDVVVHPFPTIRIEELSASGQQQLDASVISNVSDTDPGVVRVNLENRSSEDRWYWGFNEEPIPFNHTWMTPENAGNVLLVENQTVDLDNVCWFATEQPTDTAAGAVRSRGDTIGGELALSRDYAAGMDDANGTTCFAIGEYHVEQTLEIYEAPEDEPNGPPTTDRIGDVTCEMTISLTVT